MKHSNAFQLQSRLKALEMMVQHEGALINKSFHDQIARSPIEERGKVHAQREHELIQLFAWEDYLRACIANQFSSGLPRCNVNEPGSDCMPRSRRRWAEMLDEELGEEDPLLEHLKAFIIAFMIGALVHGMSEVVSTSGLLSSEMKKRFKPTSRDDSSGGDSVTKAAAVKPKPQPPRSRR